MNTKVSLFIATILSVAIFSCQPKNSMVFHGGAPAQAHKVKQAPIQTVEASSEEIVKVTPKATEITPQKPSVKEVFAAVKAVKAAKKAMPQAVAPQKELSKEEKKEAKAQMKEQIKQMKNQAKGGSGGDAMFILAVVLCFLLPPVGVLLFEGSITTNFWIDLILTLLFWLPGIIYALLVVAGVI